MDSGTLHRGKSNQEKLIFVYNANSGIRNGVMDSLHKIWSPKTYDCNLCNVTFGVFFEKKAWKDFRKRAVRELEFLHKDEFQKQYASKFGYAFQYPIILVASKGGMEVLVAKDRLDAIENPEELIQLLQSRMGL